VNRLPFLEGAWQYAGEWLFPGEPCYERNVEFAPDVPDELRMLLFSSSRFRQRSWKHFAFCR
jgi:hypothetical protein